MTTAREALCAQTKFRPPNEIWNADDIRGSEYGHWEATDSGSIGRCEIQIIKYDGLGKRMFEFFFMDAESFLNWVKETL